MALVEAKSKTIMALVEGKSNNFQLVPKQEVLLLC